MDDVSFVQGVVDALRDGGIIAVAVGLAVSLHRRWIVLGWVYDQCASRNSTLEGLLSQNTTRMESKLERLEESERTRSGIRERP